MDSETAVADASDAAAQQLEDDADQASLSDAEFVDERDDIKSFGTFCEVCGDVHPLPRCHAPDTAKPTLIALHCGQCAGNDLRAYTPVFDPVGTARPPAVYCCSVSRPGALHGEPHVTGQRFHFVGGVGHFTVDYYGEVGYLVRE